MSTCIILARKKRSISQTPTQDAGTDTGLQNDVVQEQNIIIQGDNKSSPASKQHGENRKIPNIDGTTLEFIYWNTYEKFLFCILLY